MKEEIKEMKEKTEIRGMVAAAKFLNIPKRTIYRKKHLLPTPRIVKHVQIWTEDQLLPIKQQFENYYKFKSPAKPRD